jgi:hypothetical protein
MVRDELTGSGHAEQEQALGPWTIASATVRLWDATRA